MGHRDKVGQHGGEQLPPGLVRQPWAQGDGNTLPSGKHLPPAPGRWRGNTLSPKDLSHMEGHRISPHYSRFYPSQAAELLCFLLGAFVFKCHR